MGVLSKLSSKGKVALGAAALFAFVGISHAATPPPKPKTPITPTVTVTAPITHVDGASTTSTPSPTATPTPSPIISTKQVIEKQPISYTTSTQYDSTLDTGTTVTAVAGVNGERTITYTVTYSDGVETARTVASNTVTIQPINEVKKIGTKAKAVQNNCDLNYTPCIPNTTGNALNCSDIQIMVKVIGIDHNKFDADQDGYGCESYQ